MALYPKFYRLAHFYMTPFTSETERHRSRVNSWCECTGSCGEKLQRLVDFTTVTTELDAGQVTFIVAFAMKHKQIDEDWSALRFRELYDLKTSSRNHSKARYVQRIERSSEN